MQKDFLPYGRQTVDDDDVDAVSAVLRSDWLTGGPAVAEFEEAFAGATASRYAISCSNGTAALHLAALALGLGPKDCVVVPSITFLATANAARYVGAEVVFADVDPDTGLLTADCLAKANNRAKAEGRKISAVFPVHLGGQVASIDGLAQAVTSDCAIVEDACHAIGASDAGSPVGSCRNTAMACFSLHPVKTIASGEGGVVTTNDPEFARRLRLARNHGMERDPDRFVRRELAYGRDGEVNPWYYEMPEPGFNYRLSDIHAALGRSQLKKLAQFVARRSALVDRYSRLLAPLAPVVRPVRRVSNSVPAWHLCVVLIDFEKIGVDRATMMRRLRAKGIGSQVHYIPVHQQPYYRERYGALSLPGAEAWYARALSLPLFPTMADSDVDRVVDALTEIVTGS